jgi:hypothetical protein
MANETLKITITADNKEAVNNIQQTITATNNLGNAFKSIPNSGNQAALALNNLSRIAQDAPYGFIGIANNINPMLESFQRLQATTGSTSSALKAMVSTLMGPAGVGLAIGALTSIIVAFGPEITKYVQQISAADIAQRKMSDGIAKATGSAQAEADKLIILSDIVKDNTLSTKERETALNQLQSTYKGNIELQKLDINDGARLEVVINGITEALKRKALAQAFATLIAEEEAKKARLQLDSLAEMRDKVGLAAASWTLIKAALTNASGEMASLQYNTDITNQALSQHQEEVLQTDKNITTLKSKLSDVTREQIKNGDATTTSTTALKSQDDAMKNYLIDLNAYIKAEEAISRPSRAEKRKATIVPFELNKEKTDKLSKDVPAWYTDTQNDLASKAAKDQETLNTQLQLSAELTSVVASGFNNVFETFVNGGDIGKALEESFKRIAIQLVEMVAQALIFKAILTALGVGATPLGAAALDSGMGFGGGGLLGQFLLKGSDLVLATQRANSNLTLRR